MYINLSIYQLLYIYLHIFTCTLLSMEELMSLDSKGTKEMASNPSHCPPNLYWEKGFMGYTACIVYSMLHLGYPTMHLLTI